MSLIDADNHLRTIIHLDIDCFYAQVEMVTDPTLVDRPLGIQQKNIVVTCNYVARARGVGKCMSVTEAVSVCPDLVLVNGEDLARYRKVSMGVYGTLVRATECEVERLGMDENWIDVSRMVDARIREGPEKVDEKNILGVECEDDGCGCCERLIVGSMIARELRELIRKEHGLTCSAGISYNKLLAKLGGGVNKPNDQTVVGAAGVEDLLGKLDKVTSLPGVGRKMGEILKELEVVTVDDLRRVRLESLESAGIARDIGLGIIGLAWGRDHTPVKMSGKVGIIGLEDRFMGIYDKEGVREKLVWLLNRLGVLLGEDGRKATTLKVTVRDYFKDKLVKKFSKESRQCKVSPRLLVAAGGEFKPNILQELVMVSLGLVSKMVEFDKEFHITLLGVAVTDFVEQAELKGSIKNFFSPKKCEESKQENSPGSSITGDDEDVIKVNPNIEYADKSMSEESEYQGSSPIFSKFRSPSSVTPGPRKNLFFKSEASIPKCNSLVQCSSSKTTNPTHSDQLGDSRSLQCLFNNNKRKEENQNGTCFKKSKFGEGQSSTNQAKVLKFDCPEEYDPSVWCDIPDEIKEEILLNLDHSHRQNPTPASFMVDPNCPPDIDPRVFSELPDNIKKELVLNHKAKVTPKSKSSKNNIKNYFSPK